jgi:hypothetical protein
MKSYNTILEITLQNARALNFFLLAVSAIKASSKFIQFSTNLLFGLVQKPDFWDPINTSKVHPTIICQDDCPLNIVAELAFYLVALEITLINLMHFSASHTEPLICFWKPIYKVVTIATHVDSYVTAITDYQIVSGFSVLKIAEAHVTLYIFLIIIFRQPYCGSPRKVLKAVFFILLLHLKVLFRLSAHFCQIRLKSLFSSII